MTWILTRRPNRQWQKTEIPVKQTNEKEIAPDDDEEDVSEGEV